MLKKGLILGSVVALALGAVVGCGTTSAPKTSLTGKVSLEGSSTVYPITQAVAEEFMKANPGVQVTVGQSGTGLGFSKWANGEMDINDASRAINDTEKAAAAKNNITPVEIPVANDGIAVIVNKSNTFVDSLTFDQLKKIWAAGSTVKTWKDVNPAWPATPIKLYATGAGSGTFDFFNQTILGKDGKPRTDFTANQDHNILVKGVEGDTNGLAYVGYSYYVANKDQVKLVKIDAGKGAGAIEATDATIADSSYPLSRVLYIYPSEAALKKPAVKAFVKFYIQNAKVLTAQVGYIPLSDDMYAKDLGLVK